MHHVIGSGPASIPAAVALTNRGLPVTILDAGRTLEPERQRLLRQLSQLPPEQWNADDLETLRGGDQKTRQGSIHVKLTYGSDYPWTPDPNQPLLEAPKESRFHYSMARGGMSNVWGGSILPNRATDIPDWPIRLEDLEPHYRAVLRFMPSTSVADDLAALLPMYTDTGEPLNPSRQAAAFLDDLGKARGSLGRARIHFGRSRLALATNGARTSGLRPLRALSLWVSVRTNLFDGVHPAPID